MKLNLKPEQPYKIGFTLALFSLLFFASKKEQEPDMYGRVIVKQNTKEVFEAYVKHPYLISKNTTKERLTFKGIEELGLKDVFRKTDGYKTYIELNVKPNTSDLDTPVVICIDTTELNYN